MYREGGKLPLWKLAGNETDCMIGYHSVSVMADALAKGIPFDLKSALEAALGSVRVNSRCSDIFTRQGYLGADDEPESVSKTLEYAYDDWCIAQLALAVGDTACADSFLRRSEGWKHLFDPENGLLYPRRNGGWVTPFDPREVNNNYTEANGWQYNFFVPHGMSEYIRMLGGPDRLKLQLVTCFPNHRSRPAGSRWILPV